MIHVILHFLVNRAGFCCHCGLGFGGGFRGLVGGGGGVELGG